MEQSMFPTIFGIVIGGLMVAAITGNVTMYRQVGVLNQAVIDLTKTLTEFAKRAEADQESAAEGRRDIVRKLDELERQMQDVQARVGKFKERGPEAKEETR